MPSSTAVVPQTAWLSTVAERVRLSTASPLVRSSVASGAVLVAIFAILRLRQTLGGSRRRSGKPAKQPQVPGFAPVTDQIFVRDATAAAAAAATEPSPDGDGAEPSQPDAVIVFGWGDGLPKHVAKYADGYATLFPQARQIVVLSPIAKAMFSEHAARASTMVPLVKALFPDGPGAASAPRSIAVHIMSNTGAVNYASTLRAYRDMYGHQLPHDLLVLDSTPGTTDMTWPNLVRWSRAMALGLSALVPLPFVVTQSICGAFLFANGSYLHLRGQQSAGAWSAAATRNPDLVTPSTRKLFLYSREDDLIPWQDIEDDIARNNREGWSTDAVLFHGSGHVGHMRLHTERYWHAIRESWERKVASS